MIEVDPNLKEEKSHSLSTSVDFYHRVGAFQFNLLAEGFFTKLSDVFVLENKGVNSDNILIKERRNGSGAKVMGMNLEGKMAYLNYLQIQGGMTWQKSRYNKAEKWSETEPAQRRIFRTPDVYGYLTATYTPIKPLSISLSGTYTGPMYVQHLKGVIDKDRIEHTRSFIDVGAKIAYDFKLMTAVTLQLNMGVDNLFNEYQKDFDKGADRDSNYIYGPGMPRSYFAGVKISY